MKSQIVKSINASHTSNLSVQDVFTPGEIPPESVSRSSSLSDQDAFTPGEIPLSSVFQKIERFQ